MAKQEITSPERLTIAGLELTVHQRPVKHLHLSVHPPGGQVRVVVPHGTDADKTRLFVISRLAWVRRQQRKMAAQDRPVRREYTDGESAYVWGRHYRIRLVATAGTHRVILRGEWLELHLRPATDRAGRERALNDFYRRELLEKLGPIRRDLEEKTGLVATEYRTKRMTTKWGSCTVAAKRIWLNLELARHAPACLRYIVLHELLHLRERGHTQAFRALLTLHLPGWRGTKDLLNDDPAGLPILVG
ncbi:M48 family metallopeptidase [Neolewinella antarctica]|uniref:YgjP-like metallopeptidase domain-containing protein n=1 Tax=Neolewinella antarctica TaxID=442734 RepID=A0ABX0XG48_9BACT|nr:SprT family zinc-dependent metalloprotease [Neolewinella antarctica]NJC27853.1 hypothetical protein [Neolewinella antarctica]